MSIVYDYPAVGPLVKGDTWWTSELVAKKEEPVVIEALALDDSATTVKTVAEILALALHEVERVFAVPEDMLQPGRIRFRTQLPPATWRQINAK